DLISSRAKNNCAASDVTVAIVVTSVATGATVPDISGASQRDLISIEVSVPFDAVSYAAGRYLSGNSLKGQCAMRKE
ncbi:MAG: hypothetical protein R3C59_00075, partial [Planctomycetaceae bacterium]